MKILTPLFALIVVYPASVQAQQHDTSYFGQLSYTPKSKLEGGTESNGLGNQNAFIEPRPPRITDENQPQYTLIAGFQDNYRRYYGRYSVRPSDEVSTWSISGNIDFTTNRKRLIGAFIGAGAGIAGASWGDISGNNNDNSQSFMVAANAGVTVNINAQWSVDLGYRYEKTHIKYPEDNNDQTIPADRTFRNTITNETLTLNDVLGNYRIKSISGFYLAMGVTF